MKLNKINYTTELFNPLKIICSNHSSQTKSSKNLNNDD